MADKRYVLEINSVDREYENLRTVEGHPMSDPDTWETLIPTEKGVISGGDIQDGDAVNIKRDGVTYFSGIVEERDPEITKKGEYLRVAGRHVKVYGWRKWTERREYAKEGGFFKDFYPHQAIKFILRRPKSDSPTVGFHRLGWGIYNETMSVSESGMGTDAETALGITIYHINYIINRLASSGWRSDTNPTSGDYIKIDLGSTKTICAVRVDNRNSARSSDIMTALSITTSTNDSDYFERDSIASNTALNLYFSFAPVSARYIKIAVDSNQANKWFIGEVFVYETEGAISGIGLGTISTAHAPLDEGIDQTYMRITEAIDGIVGITETSNIAWEWWINNSGNFYYGQRRGSDKSATISFVYSTEFEDVKVERSSKKRVTRALVLGKGEGNKQDEFCSGWVGSGEYEKIFTDKSLETKAACTAKANIIVERDSNPIVSVKCAVNDKYTTGAWGVGDDVTLTDSHTSLAGSYRVKKVIREYGGEGENVTIEASTSWSSFVEDYYVKNERERGISDRSDNYSLADLDDPIGPPATVTQVVATAVIEGVEINWNPNTENDLDHYILYRGTSENPTGEYFYTRSNQVIDRAVAYGTTYHYRVKAVDRAGNESTDYSNNDSATPNKVDTVDINDGAIVAAHMDAGAIVAAALAKGVQPFNSNITFIPKSGSETTVVTTTGGDIAFADETTQGIDAYDSGTLDAGIPYYIYFTVGSSTLLKSTTYSDATTGTTGLLAVVMRSSTADQKVLIQPFYSKGLNINADVLATNCVLADAIASEAVVIGKIDTDVVSRFFTTDDIKTNIEAWRHASDLTLIDGGDIFTNSITATQITTAELVGLDIRTDSGIGEGGGGAGIRIWSGGIAGYSAGTTVEFYLDPTDGYAHFGGSGAAYLDNTGIHCKSAYVEFLDSADGVIGNIQGVDGTPKYLDVYSNHLLKLRVANAYSGADTAMIQIGNAYAPSSSSAAEIRLYARFNDAICPLVSGGQNIGSATYKWGSGYFDTAVYSVHFESTGHFKTTLGQDQIVFNISGQDTFYHMCKPSDDKAWAVYNFSDTAFRCYLEESTGDMYIDGTYETFSPHLPSVTEEVIQALKNEVNKPYVERDSKGVIKCPVCKKRWGKCKDPEHRQVLHSDYAHDIGFMAMGSAKIVTFLYEEVQSLKHRIIELENK